MVSIVKTVRAVTVFYRLSFSSIYIISAMQSICQVIKARDPSRVHVFCMAKSFHIRVVRCPRSHRTGPPFELRKVSFKTLEYRLQLGQGALANSLPFL